MSHCPAQLPRTGVTEATSHGTKCRRFVSFGMETIILLYKCPGLRLHPVSSCRAPGYIYTHLMLMRPELTQDNGLGGWGRGL